MDPDTDRPVRGCIRIPVIYSILEVLGIKMLVTRSDSG